MMKLSAGQKREVTVCKEYQQAKKAAYEAGPKASQEYGGKVAVQVDRTDETAGGWEHHEVVDKRASPKDYIFSTCFRDKCGIQEDRTDKSEVGWDHNGTLQQQHQSQKYQWPCQDFEDIDSHQPAAAAIEEHGGRLLEPLDMLFQLIPHTTVLCVGDVMVDYFVYGNVNRFSPEAPVPVFQEVQRVRMLGGAGNVVRNLSALSAKTIFLSVVGYDREGEIVEHLLSELPQTQFFLMKDASRTTTVKTRYVAHNQHLLRVDHETTQHLSPEIKEDLKKNFENFLDEVDIVIFSDYGKGLFDRDLLTSLIQSVRRRGKSVIVDPKGNDYTLYCGATVVTPNLEELSQAYKKSLKNENEIVEAARSLLEKCHIETMLVTQGQEGMMLVDLQGMAQHIPAHAQALEVFDVSGAGDTVVATFSAARAATKLPALEAARFANVAASIVVEKFGTAITTLDEIKEKLLFTTKRVSSAKALTLPRAIEQVIAWKKRGLKLGFTNGCFDLLHAGHVALLAQSKAECHRLIVGLNSDASVKRLKGEERPIQKQETRSIVLSSLESVDLVVNFEEDTPISLIQQLRPDVLIKGADYTLENVVGAREVESWGGHVVLANLIPNQSTTSIIQSIKQCEEE